METKTTATIIGISVGLLAVFIIIILYLIMADKPFQSLSETLLDFMSDPLGYISKSSWIILLLIQAVYLSMDVAEATTHKELFGEIAAYFLMGLGVLIIISTLINYLKHNHGHVIHSVLEGVFYMGFGGVLIYLRIRNKHKEEQNEHDEQNKEKLLRMYQRYN
jgi:hypothetical protein